MQQLYRDVQMIYLDENLPYGDERSAALCHEQAADEEIPQSSSEELKMKRTVQSAIAWLCDQTHL